MLLLSDLIEKLFQEKKYLRAYISVVISLKVAQYLLQKAF